MSLGERFPQTCFPRYQFIRFRFGITWIGGRFWNNIFVMCVSDRDRKPNQWSSVSTAIAACTPHTEYKVRAPVSRPLCQRGGQRGEWLQARGQRTAQAPVAIEFCTESLCGQTDSLAVIRFECRLWRLYVYDDDCTSKYKYRCATATTPRLTTTLYF